MPVVKMDGKKVLMTKEEFVAYQTKLQEEQNQAQKYEQKQKARQESALLAQIEQTKAAIKSAHLERVKELSQLRKEQAEVIAAREFRYTGNDPFTRVDWIPNTNDAYEYEQEVYEYWDESLDGMRSGGTQFLGTKLVRVPAGTYWTLPGDTTKYFVAEGNESNRIYPHCTLVSDNPNRPWECDAYKVQLEKQVWEAQTQHLIQKLEQSYEAGLKGTTALGYGDLHNLLFKLAELEHKLEILQGKRSPYSQPSKNIDKNLIDRLDKELGLV